MIKLFSFFKRHKPDDTPFTREDAVDVLKLFEDGHDVVIPVGHRKKTVEFLKSQLNPITEATMEKVRARSTLTRDDLFIDGHPELKIKKFDIDRFKINFILASLPADIALVSRRFIRIALGPFDIADLMERCCLLKHKTPQTVEITIKIEEEPPNE